MSTSNLLDTDGPHSWPTLDDLIRDAVELVLSQGAAMQSTRGDCREVFGVMFTLQNPRSRVSATESRRMLFSALGELSWYLAGSNALAFIEYYLPRYKDDAEGDVLFGGYGPRLISWGRPGGAPIEQLKNTVQLLRDRRSTRRATIQLFDAADNVGYHREVPCTCTLQFLCRDDRLHLLASMRSNDAWLGLPHDIFCFTMIQEIVARSIGVDVGSYKHAIGSLHLYDRDANHASAFLAEGYQPTSTTMPAMPEGDPRPAIERFLQFEQRIRGGGAVGSDELSKLEGYWADLVRLLQTYGAFRAKDGKEIERTRARMQSPSYDPFIAAKLEALRQGGLC